MLEQLCDNILHNLFKPMLLFFYAGFLMPILRVKFEFPKPIYQGLTIYLLLAIGWHGGEELAQLHADSVGQALGFMVIGFFTNLAIGIASYGLLRAFTHLRKIDAATVSGFYGSDSAGTFVTCLGVLHATNILFAPYMPVMLAVMEIPGCLVALVIVDRLRRNGMDALGNMPNEPGYVRAVSSIPRQIAAELSTSKSAARIVKSQELLADEAELELELVGVGADEIRAESHSGHGSSSTHRGGNSHGTKPIWRSGDNSSNDPDSPRWDDEQLDELQSELAKELARESQKKSVATNKSLPPTPQPKPAPRMSETLHEVFFNPGIFLLFAGISIGFVSRWQGAAVTASGDKLFNELFQGALCLFLLEMGLTASQRLKDLKTAGWAFIGFGLLAPNLFAITGIVVAHCYSLAIGQPFDAGTYVVFAVLCGSASYIAVPAVQRLAIPEASPTLPLAAALGLTFSYNVTIGIPVYIMIASQILAFWPVGK